MDAFRDRYPATDVPASATFPRSLRAPTPDELADDIVIAYGSANFTVYRAVIDRLRPGEAFGMETRAGTYVMTRAQFEVAFPGDPHDPVRTVPGRRRCPAAATTSPTHHTQALSGSAGERPDISFG